MDRFLNRRCVHAATYPDVPATSATAATPLRLWLSCEIACQAVPLGLYRFCAIPLAPSVALLRLLLLTAKSTTRDIYQHLDTMTVFWIDTRRLGKHYRRNHQAPTWETRVA
jgi:hypothetical protein